MTDTKTMVTDFLLRELSAKTKNVGKRVLIRETKLITELTAYITNVIIIPHSDFYRIRFMDFYKLYNQNAVKALKELGNLFPYSPDYELGIAFVITIKSSLEGIQGHTSIMLEPDLEILEDEVFLESYRRI